VLHEPIAGQVRDTLQRTRLFKEMDGILTVPEGATAIVLFVHGSGSENSEMSEQPSLFASEIVR
jgi:hypothetical protein